MMVWYENVWLQRSACGVCLVGVSVVCANLMQSSIGRVSEYKQEVHRGIGGNEEGVSLEDISRVYKENGLEPMAHFDTHGGFFVKPVLSLEIVNGLAEKGRQ